MSASTQNDKSPPPAVVAAEAARLERQQVGGAPEGIADDELTSEDQLTPAMVAWFERRYAAAAGVGILAGWDEALLRQAAGLAGDTGPWRETQDLLIAAADLAAGRDPASVPEQARWAARFALAESVGHPGVRCRAFPSEVLKVALDALRIEQRRMIRAYGVVADRARAETLIAEAIDHQAAR